MKKRNKIITEDEAKNFMWVKRLAKSVIALNEVYEKVLAEVKQSNKKLDKLLFTQEIVDRLINCDEVKLTDTILGAKDFEDLFPKPKICKKLKTNVPKK